jgi:(S)-ureidoglycine aminohydrolase
MKIKATIGLLFIAGMLAAQTTSIVSSVYGWDSTTAGLASGASKKVFGGSGAILASHEMRGVTLLKGKPYILNPDSPVEKFFIVKNGAVKVQLNDSAAVLERGSVVSLQPGDRLSFTAIGATAQLYEMDYTSIASPNAERGRKAGGSFVIDWNQIAFKPHDKGGVRQFFDKQTMMLNRFDIHVTTLNPNNKSHDPHTHKNEEIILMLQGNAEMQIGTDHQKANSGDVVFLGSNVLHNLTNVGTVPCIYYAIQWN